MLERIIYEILCETRTIPLQLMVYKLAIGQP